MTGLLEGAPGLPGVSRRDAAGFVLEGVRNTLRGEGCTPSIPHHIVKNLQAARIQQDGTMPPMSGSRSAACVAA